MFKAHSNASLLRTIHLDHSETLSCLSPDALCQWKNVVETLMQGRLEICFLFEPKTLTNWTHVL